MLAELPDLGCLFDQQAARRHQPVEQFAIWIMCQRRFDGEGLGEPTDHLGVNRVVLGQASGRFGEIAHPLGIDDAYGNASLAQRRGAAALVAAAGLHHRQPDCVVAQPSDQFPLARRRARKRPPQPQRANTHVRLQFGNINADNPALVWHPPTPFLARAGSRAHATVRVEGRHRTCPSLTLRVRLRGTRAQVQRRAAAAHSRPLAHFARSR
jgi:hypothetical protein